MTQRSQSRNFLICEFQELTRISFSPCHLKWLSIKLLDLMTTTNTWIFNSKHFQTDWYFWRFWEFKEIIGVLIPFGPSFVFREWVVSWTTLVFGLMLNTVKASVLHLARPTLTVNFLPRLISWSIMLKYGLLGLNPKKTKKRYNSSSRFNCFDYVPYRLPFYLIFCQLQLLAK